MYGAHEPHSLYDVEALLYVQEAQLDKFRQELAISPVSTNVANENHQAVVVRENYASSRGCGSTNHGRGMVKATSHLEINKLINFV